MVVAPPSVHPSGFAYRFVSEARSVVPLSAIASGLFDTARVEIHDFAEVERWIALQAPKLRTAWERLRGAPSASFDSSKADFAVALCLWESGRTPEQVARVLCALPGSRAQARGWAYALRTAQRAAKTRRRRA